MGKNNHENVDAVRNVIRSHNTMLISMPQEVSLRAGLQRGVQVRVGQDLDDPPTITIKALNPVDRKKELNAFLKERKRRADNHAAKAKRKAIADKKAKAKTKADAKKAPEKKAAEMKAVA